MRCATKRYTNPRLLCKHPEQKHNIAVHINHGVAICKDEKFYRFLENQTDSINCTELLRESLVAPATSGSVTLHRPDVTDATSSAGQNQEQYTLKRRNVFSGTKKTVTLSGKIHGFS